MTLISSVMPHMTSVMMPSGEEGKMAAVLMRMSRPPKAATVASIERLAMASRSRMSTGGDGDGLLCDVTEPSSAATPAAAASIAVGDHDVGAAGCGEQSDFAADAAASAYDEDDAAAEFLLGRLAANFGFFHGPVLDAEGFDCRKGYIVGEDFEALAGSCRAGTGEAHLLLRLRQEALAPSMTWMALV